MKEKPLVRNNFVIGATSELITRYNIAPFTQKDIFLNRIISEDDVNLAKDFFKETFTNSILTYKGKTALNIALAQLNLSKRDEVCIFTTSSNFYVSGCVTLEIEKFCNWSREIKDNTKAIIVIHEFGFVYNEIEMLKEYGLPIIEDCAHSFFSQNKNSSVGKVGDYVIYSLPKFFPLQFGGVLVSKWDSGIVSKLTEVEQNYIYSCIGRLLRTIDHVKKRRVYNYKYLTDRVAEFGFTPRFQVSENEIPGVFMFNVDQSVNLPELKLFCQKNGIESSVFYGESAFFIPVHQNLQDFDLEYFVEVIREFVL